MPGATEGASSRRRLFLSFNFPSPGGAWDAGSVYGLTKGAPCCMGYPEKCPILFFKSSQPPKFDKMQCPVINWIAISVAVPIRATRLTMYIEMF